MSVQNGDLLIGGAWRRGAGPAFASTNPATAETIWTGHTADTDDLADAIAAARSAFAQWRATPFEARADVVRRFSALALAQKETLARLISDETGKALWDARTEAAAVAGKADLAFKAYDERTPTRNGGANRLTHRPHGVMAVIGPFNFPAHLPNGHIVPALIAGNTIIFKPSEMTPAVGALMAQWWQEAGLPAGVLNLVHGGAQEASRLVTDRAVNGVLFTGGVAAGRAIHAAAAGQPEKILALELGGNNPLIAWGVADAVGASTIIARSSFITTGQRCTCARRLILDAGPDGDRIIEALVATMGRLRVGPPLSEPDVFMGPLISAKAAQQVATAQAAMQATGATPIVPVRTLDFGPAYLSAGLIDMTASRQRKDEEVFGPLLQVIRVPTFDAAIEVAADTSFGLAAGLLADDPAHWESFSNRIDAGIVNWNRQTTGASGAAPFGGPGSSGNHRPAGYYAADYCAWPMASMVAEGPLKDDMPTPGLSA